MSLRARKSAVGGAITAAFALLATFADPGPNISGEVAAAPRSKASNPSAQVDHPPVPPVAPVEGERWSEAEVIAALEECVRLLAPTGAEVEVSTPIRNGQCGTPAPVLLKRVAGVELNPAAVVNCRVAAKFDQWIKEAVLPLAREVLETSVHRIITASAYTCRQRIGSPSERLSEHSFANAVDISAFVTTDGRSIDLLTGWGPTARDQQAQAATSKLAGGVAHPLSDTDPDRSSTREAHFLRRVHEQACGIFGTVLGPEANEAHRNHLHLDLAVRKRGSFCE